MVWTQVPLGEEWLAGVVVGRHEEARRVWHHVLWEDGIFGLEERSNLSTGPPPGAVLYREYATPLIAPPPGTSCSSRAACALF